MVPVMDIVPKGDYLAGTFVSANSGDGCFLRHDPCDPNTVLGTYTFALRNGRAAIAAAQSIGPEWASRSVAQRNHVVTQYAHALEGSVDRLTTTAAQETGRPRWELRSEVLATLQSIDLLASRGPELLEAQRDETIGGLARRLPLGVVAVISPVAQPIHLPTTVFLTTLLAGNCVVWKPSSRTPATAQLLAELWDSCDLPRGVFNMVQGPGDPVARDLAADPRVDLVLFGGRYEVGLRLRGYGHTAGKRWGLRSGGRGQALVLADAHQDQAIHEIALGALLSGGGRATSTSRVFVDESIFDSFAARLTEVLAETKHGHIDEPGVLYGPLVDAQVLEEFLAFSQQMAGEHTVRLPGGRDKTLGNGHHPAPLVFDMPPFAQEEKLETVAGPLLALSPVRDLSEGLHAMNQGRYGLVASVFTQDAQHFERACNSLRLGFLNWNRSTAMASFRLPAGGRGRSSNGVDGHLDLLRFCTHPLAALTQPATFDRSRIAPGFPAHLLSEPQEDPR